MRMADGPVANLPAGLDAYAGYVDAGGIGITWPEVEKIPAKYHLSISVHGAPAMCGDVESGALASWKGYTVGYAGTARVGNLIQVDGRPKKLWTAHYTEVPHICTSKVCWPSSPTIWEADGTQWHSAAYDESLLLDNFFDFQTPTHPPEDEVKFIFASAGQPTMVQSGDLVWQTSDPAPYIAQGFTVVQVSAFDITHLAVHAAGPQVTVTGSGGGVAPAKYSIAGTLTPG